METKIIITTNSNKKNILKKLSKEKKLYNIKFYTFNELKKKIFFSYDNKAIAYLMENYNVIYDIAKIYLENMYFCNNNTNNDKINFLYNLKSELESNNLLKKDTLFKNYLKEKEVIVYGYDTLTKEQKLILKDINYKLEKEPKNSFLPKIVETETIEDEVEYVANSISMLLEKVDINKIKIIANTSYNNYLKRYFKMYNIPLNIESQNSFYSTFIASEFLANYDKLSIEDNILLLENKYENINDLISIINKSVYVENKKTRKSFIIHDLKNTYLKEDLFENAINISSINDTFNTDEYVFLLGFNLNEIPKIYTDNAYLSDKEKTILGLDTSVTLNEIAKNDLLNKIKNIKNLTITYKLKNENRKCYISNLIDDLKIEISKKEDFNDVSYSSLNSKIKLASMLDDYYKYNIIDENLSLYYNSFSTNYKKYDNKFSGIDKKDLKNYLKGDLTLSYTDMEEYNECSFRYYLNKVLRLNIFDNNFKATIGSITHHILELGLTKDINIEFEIMKYIKEKEIELNSKEMFYLNLLSKELKSIIDVIKDISKTSKLNNYLFEEPLYIYKDTNDYNVTFKGVIDKVMYHKDENVIAVVDYKTGNTNITLKNLLNGLNIQLPVYLYLLKKSSKFESSAIAGFYIEKIIHNIPNITKNKTLNDIRKDNLRLHGFSSNNPRILKMLDENYENSKMVFNLSVTKSGEISKKANLLSDEDMNNIVKIVDKLIDKCILNIIEGKFDINPKIYNRKDTCEYCKFKSICYRTNSDYVEIESDIDEVDREPITSN